MPRFKTDHRAEYKDSFQKHRQNLRLVFPFQQSATERQNHRRDCCQDAARNAGQPSFAHSTSLIAPADHKKCHCVFYRCRQWHKIKHSYVHRSRQPHAAYSLQKCCRKIRRGKWIAAHHLHTACKNASRNRYHLFTCTFFMT